MSKYRWIMYVGQSSFGGSFELSRQSSLEAARQEFKDFCRSVFTDECSATLYPYSDEAWTDAEDFRDAGCPFGYPSKFIERGPRNGVRVQNA